MSWKHVTVIVAALATVVTLYLLPTPNANYRNIELEHESANSNTSDLSNEEKVKKALKTIQEGGAPMQAIGLLKEVIENEPTNELALFYLGDFSLQTGQFDKAIPRFEKLTEIAPKTPQYWYLLAQAYEMNKNSEDAINAYETFITFGTDSIIIDDVKKKIQNLK